MSLTELALFHRALRYAADPVSRARQISAEQFRPGQAKEEKLDVEQREQAITNK
jgi:hypothetical protein